MFFQFGSFPHQMPIIIWNPYFYQSGDGFTNEGTQVILTENQNSRIERFSQEVQEVTKLNKEEKLNMINLRLQDLHKDNSASKKTHWSQNQDLLLERLVQKQKMSWKEIPKFFEGRTLSMCYSRYRRILMNTKEGWKKQDDELIINMVKNMGEKWKQISIQVPKFTPKQIRERYLNYLRPNIDKSQFTFDQDLKICQLVLQQGKHWRKFEEQLPGRTQGAIKSRFYSKLKDIIENL